MDKAEQERMTRLHDTIRHLIDAQHNLYELMDVGADKLGHHYNDYMKLCDAYNHLTREYLTTYGHEWSTYHTELRKIRSPELLTAEEIAR